MLRRTPIKGTRELDLEWETGEYLQEGVSNWRLYPWLENIVEWKVQIGTKVLERRGDWKRGAS